MQEKKVSPIMEKTVVDFVYVTSSIYLFFFRSEFASGDVRCWLHLTLGSLLQDCH